MPYFAYLKRKPTYLVIFIALLASLYYIHNVQLYNKQDRVIQWDIISYYAYLPATFIYQDISLKFTEQKKPEQNYVFWGEKMPTGTYQIKTTMGLSILYAPFFFVAHAYASIFSEDSGGFSEPYKLALLYAALAYLLIGLFYLRKLLLIFVDENSAALTILAVFFGTNLFYYTANEGPMAHVFNFTLITMFFFYSIRWHQNPDYKLSILLGLLSGIIALIRPINVLVALLFLLIAFDFKKSVALFWSHRKKIFVLLIMAFVVWIPQFIYWKFVSGQWLSYSYGDERFFWLSPQIGDVLFSLRKGLFIYFPVWLLSVPGFYLLYQMQKRLFWAVFVFSLIYLYVLSSWWTWWYGGSFGQRAMIDIYGILAIPLALLIYKISKFKYFKRFVLYFLFVVFITLGIFHTAKYHYGSIHWDSMTKEALIKNYFQLKRKAEFEKWISAPDYESAKMGEGR